MPRAQELLDFLAHRGLHAATSSETMAELHQRYGERSWYGFSAVVDLPRASLFPEQSEPFYIHLNPRRYLLPPDHFTCDFNPFNNDAKNHAIALERLKAQFGKPEPGMATNTREHRWQFEDVSLTIRTFIKERSQFGRNDLYENNPGLWHVCAITIERPQWVGDLTPVEEALIAAIPPSDLLLMPGDGPQPINSGYAKRHKLFRLPSAYLWRTQSHIGWCNGGWAAMIERFSIEKLSLLQVHPAKGGGGAYLSLRIQNPYSLEREITGAEIFAAPQAHALDDLASKVAKFWRVQLSVSETHDC